MLLYPWTDRDLRVRDLSEELRQTFFIVSSWMYEADAPESLKIQSKFALVPRSLSELGAISREAIAKLAVREYEPVSYTVADILQAISIQGLHPVTLPSRGE